MFSNIILRKILQAEAAGTYATVKMPKMFVFGLYNKMTETYIR